MNQQTEIAPGAQKQRKKATPHLVEDLNEILSNEYLLFTKTLNYHWNLVGARFYSIHIFLEEQYRKLLKMMDSLAERIRYLEGHPYGTVREFNSHSSIGEDPGVYYDITGMLANLMESHNEVDRQIQELLQSEGKLYGDRATEDLLIKLQRKHQMMVWMLRSHLEAPETQRIKN